MARNEEKAMAMLNRWVQMKRDINQNKGKINEKLLKKPDDPKEAKNVTEAEVWKASLVKQIIKKVSEIQNGSLGEYRIRELNDSINEMLVEKAKWEERIRELGGRNYNEEDGQLPDESVDDMLKTKNGYKYFGAAKNLPEVKLLHKQEVPHAPKTALKELLQKVTPYYLGLEDEKEGLDAIKSDHLEAAERDAETKLRTGEAGREFKDKFFEKKRRRIELLQTQDKEVHLSDLSVDEFKSLLTSQPAANQQPTASVMK